MAMHNIEVDDDVMGYLRGKAEPFVDSPNDVLRRELLGKVASRPGRVPESKSPPKAERRSADFGVPIGMPEALRQTLEVVSCMRQLGVERTTATRLVAKRHGVARETVADKYCRQLGLTAYQLDRMLAESNLEQLSARLRTNFASFSSEIRTFLAQLPARRTS